MDSCKASDLHNSDCRKNYIQQWWDVNATTHEHRKLLHDMTSVDVVAPRRGGRNVDGLVTARPCPCRETRFRQNVSIFYNRPEIIIVFNSTQQLIYMAFRFWENTKERRAEYLYSNYVWFYPTFFVNNKAV